MTDIERIAESCLPPEGSMQRALTGRMLDEIKARIVEALGRERARVTRLRIALKQVQWGNMGASYPMCPLCDQLEGGEGHAPDCLVGMALDLSESS